MSVLPNPPQANELPYEGNPLGYGEPRIVEYIYGDLKNNNFDPNARLNIANVLDYHSNGGYGGWTQWRAWSTKSPGLIIPGEGWYWCHGKAPYDNKFSIACEFSRPVVLAGVEVGIGSYGTAVGGDATLYAWDDGDWVQVSEATHVSRALQIVTADVFVRTTRMRIVYDKASGNQDVNAHPRIFVYA